VESARAEETGIGWALDANKRSLCGLAHGNAGVATALFDAWRAGGGRDLRDAALRAIAYERSQRVDERAAWRDLREGEEEAFMATWCNGAPGIALARTRMLAIEDLPELRDDLAIAVRGTKASVLHAGHVCCGTAGVDEILFEVGRRTTDAALVEIARRRSMWRLVTAKRAGAWPHVVTRGLMRGTAGVALGLLRMTERGRDLACVLDLGA
jgi:lantibiotic modifying enzyme